MSQRTNHAKEVGMQWGALAIIGLGIGLLAGLAVSPVLSIILTSLIAAAATVTALLGHYGDSGTRPTGATSHPAAAPSAVPLALLVVTILLGAVIGLFIRVDLATSWQAARLRGLELAPPATIAASIEAWTDLGLNQEVVSQSLFEAYLGVVQTETVAQADATAATTGLFSTVSAAECDRLRAASDDTLRAEMEAGESEDVAYVAERVDDVEVLRRVVEVACGEGES